MIFGDPDIIRRVRAQSAGGMVRLCECVHDMRDHGLDSCEQLASESHAYISSLVKRYREGNRRLPGFLDDEDIVQDAMARVLRDSTQFRSETLESWKAWLAAVLNHTILDAWRRHLCHRRHSKEMADVDLGILDEGLETKLDYSQRTPDEVASVREEYQMVLEIAEAHQPGSKKLLEDYFRYGLSGQSLANRHACAPYAARRRLSRILRYLREVLPPPHTHRLSRLRLREFFCLVDGKDHAANYASAL